MKEVSDFLAQLSQNNNRQWFAAHKEEYKKINNRFNEFVEALIQGIATFDPSVKRLTVADCTYRIYRDIRFSPDKSPYKTHIGAYVCPGGKKSENAGYYFHIEPKGNGFLGNNLMTAGLYMPDRKILQSVREDIMCNGELFIAAVNKAKGFKLSMENSLKRIPTGFPAESPYSEYLKLKDVILEKHFETDFLSDPDLLKKTVAAFEKTLELNNLLNRAVDFAREEG